MEQIREEITFTAGRVIEMGAVHAEIALAMHILHDRHTLLKQ